MKQRWNRCDEAATSGGKRRLNVDWRTPKHFTLAIHQKPFRRGVTLVISPRGPCSHLQPLVER